MTKEHRFQVTESEEGSRLDKFLNDKMSNSSRSFIQYLIKEKLITLNHEPTKASHKVATGETIIVTIPEPKTLDLKPQDIPLDILFEDDDIIVVNKPKDMPVHPGAGHAESTLVNALLYQAKSLSSINGTLRPGIVHRLDKDTTGCLVIAKNDTAHQALSNQFSNRTIHKEYLAIVEKPLTKKKGEIRSFIKRNTVNRKKMMVTINEGREAVTQYNSLELFKDFSFVKLLPKTGRTHQIRVHLSSIGHPIIGDTLYNGHTRYKQFEAPRYMLHASTLKFYHPKREESLEFKAALPKDMLTILKTLGVTYDLSTL